MSISPLFTYLILIISKFWQLECYLVLFPKGKTMIKSYQLMKLVVQHLWHENMNLKTKKKKKKS